jgi:hypothetical protein
MEKGIDPKAAAFKDLLSASFPHLEGPEIAKAASNSRRGPSHKFTDATAKLDISISFQWRYGTTILTVVIPLARKLAEKDAESVHQAIKTLASDLNLGVEVIHIHPADKPFWLKHGYIQHGIGWIPNPD